VDIEEDWYGIEKEREIGAEYTGEKKEEDEERERRWN